MDAIWNSIKSNIVQWLALLLGVINLVLLLKDKFKEKIKLDIIQPDSGYNFEFLTDKKRQYALCSIEIVNKSKTATNIVKIELEDSNGNNFVAGYFGHHTDPLDSNTELCFYNKSMKSKVKFQIDSENILKSPRLESYGTISGYAFFRNVTPIREDTEHYTLKITTPKKIFKKDIILSKFSDDYASYSEVNRLFRLK